MIDHNMPLIRILERARWAPSGDNTQPWRFEIVDERHLVVHGFDTRDHVVYDLDGHSSQLAIGALLETMCIAATVEGIGCHIERRPGTPESHLLFDVRFERDDALLPDSLAPLIEKRVVQRHPMSRKQLTALQKQTLASALPDGYEVLWFHGFTERVRLARFMFDNGKIRYNIPEAYAVHRAVIEWGTRYSEDRIPARAVGVDPITERLMHWVMTSWDRTEFFNTWLLGDLAPRVLLDFVPGLFCGAHFVLLAPSSRATVDDYIAAGRAMQRFWLTAASLGLFVQPEMTPVIFSRYHRAGITFSRIASAQQTAGHLNSRLMNFLPGRDVNSLFFMGRIGAGPTPKARSTRKALGALMTLDEPKPR